MIIPIAWGIAKSLVRSTVPKSRSPTRARQLLKRVKPLAGDRLVGISWCCATSRASPGVDAVFDAMKKKWGTIDFFVHAVGFSDKSELKGALPIPQRENFRAHDGDLLLLLRGGFTKRAAELMPKMAAPC